MAVYRVICTQFFGCENLIFDSIIESIDSITNSKRVIMNTLDEDDEHQEGEQQTQQQESEKCKISHDDFDSNELYH
jgi:hypothetical protein